MIKLLKSALGTGLIVSAVLAGSVDADAKSVVFAKDFQDENTFANDFRVTSYASDTSNTWMWGKYTTGSRNYYYAKCYSYSKTSYNDYLTLAQPVSLVAGHAYEIAFDAWCEDSEKVNSANIEVKYGKGSDETAYTRIIGVAPGYINKYNGATPSNYTWVFEVEQSGFYYLTFQANGMAGVGIDNIVLSDIGSAGTPSLPTDMMAMAMTGDMMNNSVHINYMLPTTSITGDMLSNISSTTIYRDGTPVMQFTDDLYPGGMVDWDDSMVPNGWIEYTATASYNGEEGPAASARVFVGTPTPLPVTGVNIASSAPGQFSLSWNAPSGSVEGMYIEPSQLSYRVHRVVADNPSLDAYFNVYSTEFSDYIESDSRIEIHYDITAVLNDRCESQAVSSATVKVGALSVPFSDSFTDFGTGSSEWSAITLVGSNYNWERVTSGSNPYCAPQDNDGAMMQYNSYNSQSGNSARLYTEPISAAQASNLVLSIWVYHGNTGYKNDYIEIELACDDSDWNPIPDSQIAQKATAAGWVEHLVPLQQYLQGCSYFRLGIKAVSDYGYRMYVDNVKLYNALAYDLSASNMDVADNHVAGNNAEVKVYVENKGADTVAADDYSVVLYLNDEEIDSCQGVDVDASSVASLTFTVPFNATHISDVNHKLKATVIYAADEDISNNSVSAEVAVAGSIYPRIAEIRVNQSESAIILDWDAPVDTEGYVPTNISENFATCSNTADGQLAGTDWTVIDADNQEASSSLYGFKAGTWNIFSTTSTSSYAPKSQDGGIFIAMISPRDAAADDWLISPALNSFESAMFNLTFSAACNISGSKLEVYYSTSDPTPQSFVKVKDVVLSVAYQGYGWYPYSVAIPGNAKYVAIRNTSVSEGYDARMICLDKVAVVSDMPVINGYHVYQNGRKHNEEPLTTTHYEIPFGTALRAAAGPLTYHVTALYDDGETALSEPVSAVISGVDAVENGAYGVKVVAGGVVTSAAAEVYSLDGHRVALCNEAANILLDAGIYIVRTEGKNIKVYVK